MKKLSVLLFAGFMGMATVACKHKQQVADAEVPPVNNTVPETNSISKAPTPAGLDSLLISYERTPCFGKCPAYIVNVYQSGYATYEGKSNAKYTGMYFTYIDKTIIKDIQDQAQSGGFFTLNNEYGGGVSDLPWQKTYIKRKVTSKRIVNKGGEEIPQSLSDMQQMLDRVLNELEWKPLQAKK